MSWGKDEEISALRAQCERLNAIIDSAETVLGVERARAERAERERDVAIERDRDGTGHFNAIAQEFVEAENRAQAARAWARRWKRAAKGARKMRSILEDTAVGLHSRLSDTRERVTCLTSFLAEANEVNAGLRARNAGLRERLEKWRTAERRTQGGPGGEPVTWVKCPEGEE